MECGLTNPARAGRQQRQFALHPPWSPWHTFKCGTGMGKAESGKRKAACHAEAHRAKGGKAETREKGSTFNANRKSKIDENRKTEAACHAEAHRAKGGKAETREIGSTFNANRKSKIGSGLPRRSPQGEGGKAETREIG